MKVTLEKFKKENLEEIHQMYNKINQLNSTTRRLNRTNILIDPKKEKFSLRLKDKLLILESLVSLNIKLVTKCNC